MPAFDQTLSRFYQLTRQAVARSGRIQRLFRQQKQDAFEAAKVYVELLRQHTNELREHVKSEGFADIDAWLREHTPAFEVAGDRWPDMVQAIHAGMTLEDYLQGTADMYLASRRPSRRKASSAAPRPELPELPQPPDAEAPVDVQLAELRQENRDLRELYATARAQIRELRGELTETKRRCEKYERQMRQLHGMMQRAEAKIVETTGHK